jgi:hypothetical protein
MNMVTEYSWESDTWTRNGDTTARQAWRRAIADIVAKAHAKLPESASRIDKAAAIVLAGDVELLPDGGAKVASQSRGSTTYHVVNGHCDCRDFDKAPGQLCKHRLAYGMTRRARELLQTTPPAASEPGDVPATADVASAGIDPRYVVTIQGKPFVKFAGLLQMALERGLIGLTADWTFNDATLSLAHAVAIFQDGRRFEESGDASPENCTKTVAAHFRRVALTRAKARVLRDALGVDLVAVEELADE